jgi:hypothetical protein
MFPIESALKLYVDSDGNPLDGGYIYFGSPNQNPITAPVTVYWDSAGTQPAAQPLRTQNGYIVRNGTPANVFCSVLYSQLVQDNRQVQIYYAPTSNDYSIAYYVQSTIGNLITSIGSSLIGFIQAGVGAVLRTVQAKLRDTISVMDFGAIGDGVTDDTAAINLAYAAVTTRGATIWWPNGKYKVSGPITVKSNTKTVFAGGASLAPVPIASFTPLIMPGHGAWGYAIFANANWGASSLTDSNITYDGVNVVPDAAWNGHFISGRYITNLKIMNGYGQDGADYCSVLACHQVVVDNNYMIRASNCAYDFWDGNVDVKVIDNDAMLCTSAAVNVNAMGTYSENRASYNFLVKGNNFQSAGGTLAGSLIYVSPLNAGSTLQDIKIIHNHIDQNGGTGVNSPNGITVQRTKNAYLSENEIVNVGAGSLPIIVTADPFPGVSDGCSVVNNRVVDSFIGAQSMIGAFGTNHYVAGNKSINSNAIGGNGIQVDDPSTIVLANDMVGATIAVQNSHAGGGATTPAGELTYDKTNSRWYTRQRVRTEVAFSQVPDYAVTATGTNLATAYAIHSAYTYFSTVAASTGAAVPSAAASLGEEKVIWNFGANTLTVYAQSGETIGGSASITVAAGA